LTETILSVGIDLGTSTTQLILSELEIQNMASSFTVPRIVISDKRIIFRSEILFTPILADNLIDVEAIRDFVTKEYANAGIKKEEIGMGAVIITGETARKDNASNVLDAMSGFAGDFVVATAGPDLESIIAGKGAGAHTYAKENNTSVVNLDIGGGTTNLSLFDRGELIDTACLDIGGRLIKVDRETRKITYIAPKIQALIEKRGYPVKLGETTSPENLQPVLGEMVELLKNSVGLGAPNDFYETIITNKGLKFLTEIECISFSGGVADCISTGALSDPFRYGDIGLLLGKAIAESSLMTEKKYIESVETIRATVVGAGSHTAEISGSTITYTEKIFPVKNIPILKLAKQEEDENMAEVIKEKLSWFKIENEMEHIALAIEGENSPSFQQVTEYAKAICEGMKEPISLGHPLIIITWHDMAKALGQSIFGHLPAGHPLICLDSVKVDNGDYIDIGKPVADGKVLPVVVKTLVFN
jgi:Reactivating factor of Adenosylcobalamin-dependent ethanolamine ammonia lyase